jgi:kojibiose phosphorylase
VARETFRIANAAVAHLKKKHPAALRALVKKLRIARELPDFQDAAAKLYVPAPDPQTGVIEQFDGYHQLQETTVAALKAKMIHPYEYLGGGQGLAVPTQIIKQADVVMMLNLFKSRYSAAIKRANWEHYEPRTEHGSSLSACAYALVAAEFGKLDFAYEYFLKTARIDLEAKYKVYVGTIFIGGSHPAANGGAWMTAVLGFGGVQADDRQLAINPRLPRQWRALEFNVVHRGDSFRVGITPRAISLTAAPANRRIREVVVAGRTVKCPPGRTVTVKYRAAKTT